jgi:TonB family protein
LETAIFDGGTDFSKIDLYNIAGDEILFFSDGISTLSDADFLKDAEADRPIHCVVSSARADYSVMKLIAGKTKGKFVNVNALSSEKLTNELLYETPMFLGTEHGDLVREVYPGIAAPVHGNFSVAGISAMNNQELTLLFGFGDKVEHRIKVNLEAEDAAGQGKTYKIWAQKKIAELDLDYGKNSAELAGLGKQFGIVTRNTSLIVLESVDDYVLFGLEPPASEPALRAEYRRRTGFHKPVANVFGPGFRSGGGDGRRGSAGIGYGTGYGSGFGSPGFGGGGIDDLLGGLMGGGGGLPLRKNGELKISSPDFIKGGTLTGGRSRASIQRVIMQNIAALRYAYNRRCRDIPGLNGTITVNFAVDEFGKVIFAQAVKSTVNDAELENTVVDRVKSWNFEWIDKPGDVTEVTYPFAFSQDVKPVSEETAETRERIARAMEENAQTKIEAIARAVGGDEATQKKRGEAARQRERDEQARREKIARERERREREYAIDYALNGAASTAANLKRWWNTNFCAPQTSKSKYPAPDGTVPDINSAKGGFAKDKDYLKNLTGKIADDYQTYLTLRNGHANSPAYYYDMADWFYTLGDRETALRVLTSIADLELENASLYRLLGYRFKEYGEYALEKFVCQKVIRWRPIEPQSYRDYALALADNGETQEALDSLCALLEKPYSENIRSRSHGAVEAVVMEINHLIAKNPDLNVSKVNKRLIINAPVDIRVVANWNMDNTDIDLHVIDPNGEECYYGHRETRIGGRISTVPSGYGPEQFLLKNAIAGKYRVYVSYYSRREFATAGPYTIMAEIYTKYAGKAEQHKVVTLQMSNVKRTGDGKAMVAEFSF